MLAKPILAFEALFSARGAKNSCACEGGKGMMDWRGQPQIHTLSFLEDGKKKFVLLILRVTRLSETVVRGGGVRSDEETLK